MVSPTSSPTDAAPAVFARAEAALLADALGLDPARVVARTCEPLGRGSVAGFDVGATDTPSSPGVGSEGEVLRYYVDTSRQPVDVETGLALGDPSAPEARVWLHPADPHLPALAAAAFGHAAEALLARLGIVAVASPVLIAYRPGRRAVLRISTEEGDTWIKVVRPSRVERIVGLHRVLRAGGVPVPAVRGWAPDGLIVIDDARGNAAPDVEWDPERLLDAVDDVRARLAHVPLDEPGALGCSSAGAARRLPWYRERLEAGPAGELAHQAASVVAVLERTFPLAGRPLTTVHGDLHFGQLFLDEQDAVTSVIDVDTAGVGDPAEDAAAFIAHAIASALLTTDPAGRRRVRRLADGALARWGGDPAVRPLSAVHLIGHALGTMDRGDAAMAKVLIGAADALTRTAGTTGRDPKRRLTITFERT